MSEIIALIYSYGRAAWRRHWWAVIAAWIVAPAAWVVVLLLPDRYEANASVFVNTATQVRSVTQGIATQDNYQSQLSRVREALLSRPQLQAVARQTNLDAKATTPAQLDVLITKLRQQIDVSVAAPLAGGDDQRSADSIYSISYQHPNRDMSIRVVRTLMDNFLEGTKSGQSGGTSEAQTFLNKQIEEVQKKLQDEETRIADFKSRNIGMVPGANGGDYWARLQSAMTSANTAETNIVLARTRQAALQKQSADLEASVKASVEAGNGGFAGNALEVSLRKEAAREELRKLKERYKDNWSTVVAQQKLVDELTAQEEKELAELKAKGGMALRPLANNPAYQQIQAELFKVQVEISSLQAEMRKHQSEVAKLSSVTNQGPELEQELKELTRNYDADQAQYQSLIVKLGQSEIADEAARVGVVDFDIINPPHAAFEPAWPNRQLFFAAGLFAALMFGVGLALLPHLIFPTFDDIGLLQRKFGFPVLGAVSALRSPAQRGVEQRQVRHVVIAVAALVFAAGVLIVAGEMGSRVVQRLLA